LRDEVAMGHLELSTIYHVDRKWPERYVVKRGAKLLDGHAGIIATSLSRHNAHNRQDRPMTTVSAVHVDPLQPVT
jgi:hypothetical protein